jgi:hypothetical protein
MSNPNAFRLASEKQRQHTRAASFLRRFFRLGRTELYNPSVLSQRLAVSHDRIGSSSGQRLAFIRGPGYDQELMTSSVQKIPHILRNVSLFQDMDDETLWTLVPFLTSRKFRSGDLIFRELDPSDALYIVEHGQVVVSKHISGDTDIVLTRFLPGDFFGEMGLFDEAPRSASAHAEFDTTVWRLDRSVFHDLLTNKPEIGARICYQLVIVFIQRLRTTNDQAREAVRWGLEATGYSPGRESTFFGRKST